jgi:hypothetical protein
MPQSPYQQYEETSFVNTAPFTSVKSRCTVLAVPGAHAVPRRSLISQRALNGERLDAYSVRNLAKDPHSSQQGVVVNSKIDGGRT